MVERKISHPSTAHRIEWWDIKVARDLRRPFWLVVRWENTNWWYQRKHNVTYRHQQACRFGKKTAHMCQNPGTTGATTLPNCNLSMKQSVWGVRSLGSNIPQSMLWRESVLACHARKCAAPQNWPWICLFQRNPDIPNNFPSYSKSLEILQPPQIKIAQNSWWKIIESNNKRLSPKSRHVWWQKRTHQNPGGEGVPR